MSGWTPESVERLQVLWASGLSASQIGNVLGLSRNAVLGKVHRMGFPGRAARIYVSPVPRFVTKALKVKRRTPQTPRQVEPSIAPEPFEFTASAWQPLPGSTPVTMDLVTGCRWPVGDPFTVSAASLFCNCTPADGSSYCAEHARRAKGKGNANERYAIKAARRAVDYERWVREAA